MKTLDRVLVILGIFIALFVISMIVLFCIFQSIPDTLVVSVLGSGGTECILCAIIQIVKHKKGVDNEDSDV